MPKNKSKKRPCKKNKYKQMKMKLKYPVTLLLSVFLLSACYEDDYYPAANFTASGYVPGFKWKLDASASVTLSGQSLEYRWNADADYTEFDTPWSDSPVYTPVGHTLELPLNFVTLQVRDGRGQITEVSKQVFRNPFIYNFWHDTLNHSGLIIPYKRYYFMRNSKMYGGDWTPKNVRITDPVNAKNLADSAQYGSFINWEKAKSIQLINYFNLPLKEDWQILIEHFNGADLAGYNLQVDNLYGLALGLHGYMNNNQLLLKGVRGYYWTADEVDATHAWAVEISNNTDSVRFVVLPKTYQCKVRLTHRHNN